MYRRYCTKCERCGRKYDEVHIPKILPNCSHTMCSKCIDYLRYTYDPECPRDDIPIERDRGADTYITNLTLLQLIDEQEKLAKAGICTSHNEPMSMFCVTDEVKICRYCVDGRDDAKHRGHSIKTFSQLKEDAKAKCVEIESIIKEISTARRDSMLLLLDQQKEANENKKRKFDMIRGLIDKKEEGISAEIELVFTQKRSKTEEVFRKDGELNEKVRIDLALLNKKKMNDKFFDVLNKEIDEKCVVKDKEEQKLDTLNRKVVNEFKSKEKSLNNELVSIFSEHHPNVGIYEIEESKEEYSIDLIETSLKVKRKGDLINIQYRKVSEPKSKIMKEHAFVLANSDGVRAVNIDLRRQKSDDEKMGPQLCLLLKSLSNIKEISLNWDHPGTRLSWIELFFQKFLAAQDLETFIFNMREKRKETLFNFFRDKNRSSFSTEQLEKMVNLKTLCFSWDGRCGWGADYYDLRTFANKVLPALTKLTTLELKIVEASAEEWAIEDFLTEMSGILKRVNNFHFSLVRTKASPINQCFKLLWENLLPSLDVLETFTLKMDHNHFDDFEVKQCFVKSKVQFSKLRVFELSLSFTETVSNKSVKALAKYILPTMTCLESLSLNFTDKAGEITDRSAIKVFEKVFPNNIKTFKFHMGGHKLTNDTVIAFAHDLLPKLIKLENLDLVFDSPDITSVGLHELWISLNPVLKNLQTFSFSFRNGDPGEKSINYFIDETLSGMTSLSGLELSIADNFSKESYRNLFAKLKTMGGNLKNLNLELMSDKVITDQEIEFFAVEVLPLMTILKRLKLNLSWTNLTSKSLIKICEQLKVMNELEYLEILHVKVNWPKPELEEFKKGNPDIIIYEEKIFYV